MGATGYIIKGHNGGRGGEARKEVVVSPADGTIDVEKVETFDKVDFRIKTTYDGYETIIVGSPASGGYFKAAHIKFNEENRRYRLVCILNGGSYTPVAKDFAIYYIKFGWKTGGVNENHWYIEEYSRQGNGAYVSLEQIALNEYNVLIHTPTGYAYANIGVLKEDKEPDVTIDHFNNNTTRYTPTGTIIETETPAWKNGALVDTNPEDLEIRNGLLQLADRSSTDGLGYVILRPDKTFAEQVVHTNTIYEVRYNFDLNGASVTIPANCTLNFVGGKVTDGTLIGNFYTLGEEELYKVLDVSIEGLVNVEDGGTANLLLQGLIPNNEDYSVKNGLIFKKLIDSKCSFRCSEKFYITIPSNTIIDYPILINGGSFVFEGGFGIDEGFSIELNSVYISSVSFNYLFLIQAISFDIPYIRILNSTINNNTFRFQFADVALIGINDLYIEGNEFNGGGHTILQVTNSSWAKRCTINSNIVSDCISFCYFGHTNGYASSYEKHKISVPVIFTNNRVNIGVQNTNFYVTPILVETKTAIIENNTFEDIFNLSNESQATAYDIYASVGYLYYRNNTINNMACLGVTESSSSYLCEIAKSKQMAGFDYSVRVIENNIWSFDKQYTISKGMPNNFCFTMFGFTDEVQNLYFRNNNIIADGITEKGTNYFRVKNAVIEGNNFLVGGYLTYFLIIGSQVERNILIKNNQSSVTARIANISVRQDSVNNEENISLIDNKGFIIHPFGGNITSMNNTGDDTIPHATISNPYPSTYKSNIGSIEGHFSYKTMPLSETTASINFGSYRVKAIYTLDCGSNVNMITMRINNNALITLSDGMSTYHLCIIKEAGSGRCIIVEKNAYFDFTWAAGEEISGSWQTGFFSTYRLRMDSSTDDVVFTFRGTSAKVISIDTKTYNAPTIDFTKDAYTTADRPTYLLQSNAGQRIFDTTIGKPIYWTGAKWVDANGNDLQ